MVLNNLEIEILSIIQKILSLWFLVLEMAWASLSSLYDTLTRKVRNILEVDYTYVTSDSSLQLLKALSGINQAFRDSNERGSASGGDLAAGVSRGELSIEASCDTADCSLVSIQWVPQLFEQLEFFHVNKSCKIGCCGNNTYQIIQNMILSQGSELKLSPL